ncbi:MAG: cytochrome b/b6 domain-containing protein [Desulfobacterales bacterium]|nr:cytochrome b/b6 domain-containing protein [Desulfobacterales bacterium]
MKGKMTNIYLYTRYERSGHWLQAALILILLVTGFEIKDKCTLLGYETAVSVHNFVGLAWLIAFAFYVFWVFTTNEWRQYAPTTRKLLHVVRYYSWGIFKGEAHPAPKRIDAKHNPLQRLTYLGLSAVLLPVQMLSGFMYWGYNSWAEWGFDFISLQIMAYVHIAGAFAMLTFLIIHVYMTTTGHSIGAHIKAMITGWEAVAEDQPIEEWEQADKTHADVPV